MPPLRVAVLPLIHPAGGQKTLGLGGDRQYGGKIVLRSGAAFHRLGQGRAGQLPFQLRQQLLILFGGQIQLFIQVGPALPGAQKGLLPPPSLDFGVVAGGQDLRNFSAVPHSGAGILGILQQTVPVALIFKALGVGQHPRHQAAHRVRHRHGGDLSAGEHEIPQGNLLVHALVDEPLVDSLIVAAHQDQMALFPGQPSGVRLGKGFAAGGEEDGEWALFIPLADVFPAPVQRVGLEHRPPASAIGVVVHLVLLIGGVVPDLVGFDAQDVPLLRPAQDGLGQHVAHRVREQRHNVDVIHGYMPSIRRTLM